MRIKPLEAEAHRFLLVDLAQIVIEAFDFQPVTVRRHHAPPGQIVERGAPQYGLFAAGVHGDVAADARCFGRRGVDRENQAGAFSRLRHAFGHYTGARSHRADRVVDAGQIDEFDRTNINELFGIDDYGIRRQRNGAAGIAGAAATRNDGQAELDAVAHQRPDLVFGIGIEDHERILDTPVGGVGNVRDAGQTVEGDVVFAGMLAQDTQHLASACGHRVEVFGKAANGIVGCLEQLRHFFVAITTLFDFRQTMAQRRDQRALALTVLEQIIFQIRVTLHNPDIAQHFVQHAGRAAGHAFAA